MGGKKRHDTSQRRAGGLDSCGRNTRYPSMPICKGKLNRRLQSLVPGERRWSGCVKLSVDRSVSENGPYFGTASDVAGCRVWHKKEADFSVSDAAHGPKVTSTTRLQWMRPAIWQSAASFPRHRRVEGTSRPAARVCIFMRESGPCTFRHLQVQFKRAVRCAKREESLHKCPTSFPH